MNNKLIFLFLWNDFNLFHIIISFRVRTIKTFWVIRNFKRKDFHLLRGCILAIQLITTGIFVHFLSKTSTSSNFLEFFSIINYSYHQQATSEKHTSTLFSPFWKFSCLHYFALRDEIRNLQEIFSSKSISLFICDMQWYPNISKKSYLTYT